MNKKFSTLVAGLLLAGGVLSPAMAEKLSQVIGDNKFYKLEEGAFMDRTAASPTWSDVNARGWYLNLNENGVGVVEQTVTDYWKVVPVAGGIKLVNLEGESLKVGTQDVFTLYEGSVAPADAFSQLKDGNTYIGYAATQPYLLGNRELGYACAWDAVETSLVDVNGSATPADGKTYYLLTADGLVNSTIYKLSYDENREVWTFTKNQGGAFAVDGVRDFVLNPAGNGYVITTVLGDNVLTVNNGIFAWSSEPSEAQIFSFEATNTQENVNVGVLNYYEQDGFSVEIYYDVKSDGHLDEDHLSTGIAGNEFVGHLTPMKFVNGKFEPAASYDNTFWLKNEDGNFVVAVPFDVQTALPTESLYKFTTVDETTLKHNLNRVSIDGQAYYGEFAAYVDEAAWDANARKIDEITWLRVNVAKITSSTATWATIGHANISRVATLVAANDQASLTTTLFPIYISLNAGQVVSQYDLVKAKYYTVEKLNAKGQSLGHLVVNSTSPSTLNTSNFVEKYGNDLEGQFALTVVSDQYVFTNRENTRATWSIDMDRLYTTDKDDTYKYGSDIYVIKTVDNTTDADGYKRFSDSELNRSYNIAFSSNVFGNNAYFVENHEDGDLAHVIGLETTTDNALVFNMKKYNDGVKVEENKTNHRYYYTPSDSIFVESTLMYYNAKKQPKYVKDTLKILAYSFVNQWNEPLMFGTHDKAKNTYYSKVYKVEGDNKVKYANAEEAHADAAKFLIRYDANSTTKFNLRPIEHAWNKTPILESALTANTQLHQTLYEYDWSKVYAGDAAEGILAKTNLYNRTENDLFVIEETEKEVYRSLAAANENGTQTISIYREGAEKTLLFENGEFLGLANIAEFPEMAPAMLADTAYVRYETYKPQYLLVVNPTVVPAGTYCPIHGENATCEHATETKGWVEGRYLVNLVDSAKAWDNAHKHQAGNPYKNTEGLYKLGFVQATHKKDSLIIASNDKQIFLGNNKNVNGKYAFRYVDTAAKSFTIETTLDGSNTPGYLKWMNGVVVAVADVKNADVFNLNEDEDRTPTANEAVAAEVSVVAVKGAIIVKGAAGKVVTVANILGQTIANQVAASDNVTIAAPAGVAVVTVDGEATKVVVK